MNKIHRCCKCQTDHFVNDIEFVIIGMETILLCRQCVDRMYSFLSEKLIGVKGSSMTLAEIDRMNSERAMSYARKDFMVE